MKLCLKSLQEFVRLQTFNRRGFQQIQLDMEFLRSTLKDAAEDEAAVDFLLDEVRTTTFCDFCKPSTYLDERFIFEELLTLLHMERGKITFNWYVNYQKIEMTN